METDFISQFIDHSSDCMKKYCCASVVYIIFVWTNLYCGLSIMSPKGVKYV